MSNAPSINWLDRFFVSAFTVDDQGRGVLTATETQTSGDPVFTIRDKYGSTSTAVNAPIDVPLPWAVAAGSVWGIDVIVVAKGTGIRRRIKVSQVVYGDGATATLDGANIVSAEGTGTPTASITVSGSAINLTLTPDTVSAVTWGYEIHVQQL